MTYELIQSLLTLLLEITVIAGLAGIFTHALYTAHRDWMHRYCPPVAPQPTEEIDTELLVAPEPEQTPAPETESLLCEYNPDFYWETAQPDGSAWEICTPLTCEWNAPAQPKRHRGRPKKQQPTLAQTLGIEPPADWGKVKTA